jgi:hypothetical protein
VATARKKGKSAAEVCGMTVEQWQAAKEQAEDARSRGRRPAGSSANFEQWGPVAGQLGLFDK